MKAQKKQPIFSKNHRDDLRHFLRRLRHPRRSRICVRRNRSGCAPARERFRRFRVPGGSARARSFRRDCRAVEHCAGNESGDHLDAEPDSYRPFERDRAGDYAIDGGMDGRKRHDTRARNVCTHSPHGYAKRLRSGRSEFDLLRPDRWRVHAGDSGVHARDYCRCHRGAGGNWSAGDSGWTNPGCRHLFRPEQFHDHICDACGACHNAYRVRF